MEYVGLREDEGRGERTRKYLLFPTHFLFRKKVTTNKQKIHTLLLRTGWALETSTTSKCTTDSLHTLLCDDVTTLEKHGRTLVVGVLLGDGANKDGVILILLVEVNFDGRSLRLIHLGSKGSRLFVHHRVELGDAW